MNKSLLLPFVFLGLFLGLIAALMFVDVQPIGPLGSVIGLASINSIFQKIFSFNKFFFNLTEVLGYVYLLPICFYALVGLVQLIKTKSLKEVDKDIIGLGLLFIITFALNVFFKKVIINYRPILMEGVLEEGFPSSHALLAFVVFGSCLARLKAKGSELGLQIILIGLMIVMAVGRLASGVHWFTDILGAGLISLSLVSFYNRIFLNNN